MCGSSNTYATVTTLTPLSTPVVNGRERKRCVLPSGKHFYNLCIPFRPFHYLYLPQTTTFVPSGLHPFWLFLCDLLTFYDSLDPLVYPWSGLELFLPSVKGYLSMVCIWYYGHYVYTLHLHNYMDYDYSDYRFWIPDENWSRFIYGMSWYVDSIMWTLLELLLVEIPLWTYLPNLLTRSLTLMCMRATKWLFGDNKV
jgi:hypothetical protein